jgi:hypothetical protein
MPRYKLHYNEGCPDCVKLARVNARLDWLRRFERTTAPSPNGTPEIGDIHVVDTRTGVIFSGAYATRVVCQNIPLLWPAGLAMAIPAVFRKMEHSKPGCNGDRCSLG